MAELSLGVEAAWKKVEQISYGRVMAEEREALLHFVEEPLREAVGVMFDKNVPTVGSSCNYRDYLNGFAWINVDYDYMTSRNRKVVDRYDHMEKFTVNNRNLRKVLTVAGLKFPIERSRDLPSDIGARAIDLAHMFFDQPNLVPKNV